MCTKKAAHSAGTFLSAHCLEQPGPVRTSLDQLDLLGPFQTILDHLGQEWTISKLSAKACKYVLLST